MSKKKEKTLWSFLRLPGRSLRRQILAGNILIGALLLVAAVIVALQVGRLVSAVDTLQEARRHVDAAVAVRQQTTGLLASVTSLLPDEDAEQFADEVSQGLDSLRASRAQLLSVVDAMEDPETAAAAAEVDRQVTNVTNVADTMVRQARAESWPSVRVRVGVLNRDQEQVLDAVDNLLSRVQATESEASQQLAAAERAVVIYPAIVFLATLVAGALLAFRVVTGVSGPVERLTEGATQLASGSFDRRVEVEREDEIGQLARAFNSMADQLQIYYGHLEERVAERTRALETSLQVSRRLSTILDRQTLVSEVVDQVQEAFDYYHVHIYLFDDARRNLLMVGGTGEAGRTMLVQGHRLAAGQGLVGRTAARDEVTLVPDVGREPDWLPNPLLPETKAEVAVPISYGGEVQGVLDVQHDQIGGLDENDVDLLQVIAAQVAVALQNARLLQQAETRAERAAQINTINRRIQNATSVESVLQIAAQELGKALHVESAQVELSAPQGGPSWMKERDKADLPQENGEQQT